MAFYNGVYKTDDSFREFSEVVNERDQLIFPYSQNGNIWLLGRHNQKITNYFTGESWSFDRFDENELYSALSMNEDSLIWLGSSKAIYIIDKKGIIDEIPITSTGDNLIPRKVRQFLFQDSIIWVVKDREALWKVSYTNKEFKILDTYTTKNGLGSNRVTDLQQDSQGRIFASTPAGLSIYNSQKNRFINYDKNDGLEDEELTQGLEIIGNTVFLFGQGVQYATTSLLKSEDAVPEVSLGTIKVNNEKRDLKELELLSYSENNISIDFIALQLSAPGDISYRYRLNSDNDWTYQHAKQTIIQLSDLSPGNYNIEIKARSKLSDWSSMNPIQVNISKAFWNSWWFLTIIAALLVGIVSLVARKREQQIKVIAEMETKMAELENEALRAQMNPHFIFNSLNSIKSFIINEKKEEAADYLTSFAELIRLVLSNSRNKIIPLSKEFEALQLYMDIENLRLNNKFTYIWNIDKDIQLEQAVIPPLSLQPFVENAIWHGFVHKKDKGTLQLSVTKLNGHLKIVIQDDGVGRKRSGEIEKQNQRRKSFGILLTRKRLQMDPDNSVEKNIEIIDLYDNQGNATGTRIEILIPYSQL